MNVYAYINTHVDTNHTKKSHLLLLFVQRLDAALLPHSLHRFFPLLLQFSSYHSLLKVNKLMKFGSCCLIPLHYEKCKEQSDIHIYLRKGKYESYVEDILFLLSLLFLVFFLILYVTHDSPAVSVSPSQPIRNSVDEAT